jgi:hypothetical protein
MVSRNRVPVDRLQAVINSLPERFLTADVVVGDGGAMIGLRNYVADLGNHLRVTLGSDTPPVIDVMTAIGIGPAEWYRAALTYPGAADNHPVMKARRPEYVPPAEPERKKDFLRVVK